MGLACKARLQRIIFAGYAPRAESVGPHPMQSEMLWEFQGQCIPKPGLGGRQRLFLRAKLGLLNCWP